MSYHMCPIRQTLLGIQNLPTTCRVLLFVFFLSDKSTDKKRPLFRAWGRPCPQLSSHTPHTREKSPQQKKNTAGYIMKLLKIRAVSKGIGMDLGHLSPVALSNDFFPFKKHNPWVSWQDHCFSSDIFISNSRGLLYYYLWLAWLSGQTVRYNPPVPLGFPIIFFKFQQSPMDHVTTPKPGPQVEHQTWTINPTDLGRFRHGDILLGHKILALPIPWGSSQGLVCQVVNDPGDGKSPIPGPVICCEDAWNK